MKIQMLFASIAMAVTLSSAGTAASGEDVEFKCELTGGGNRGFKITAKNSGKDLKHCKATCEVTKKDGSAYSPEFSNDVRADGTGWVEFDGETSVDGAPLKDPKMKSHSCH